MQLLRVVRVSDSLLGVELHLGREQLLFELECQVLLEFQAGRELGELVFKGRDEGVVMVHRDSGRGDQLGVVLKVAFKEGGGLGVYEFKRLFSRY
jgi:hypothetical protein